MSRKGIILAGGPGTRLHPATLAVIRETLLISSPQDTPTPPYA